MVSTVSSQKVQREHDPSAVDFPISARSSDDVDLTALTLLQEALDKHAKRSSKYEARALRNEMYYHGDQFQDVNESTLEVEDLDWLSDVPQVYRNYLRALENTYAARLLKDRPDVGAYPNDPTALDIGAVEVANQVLYHIHTVNEIDDLLYTGAIDCQNHAVTGIKVVWDPSKGPKGADIYDLDEMGEPVLLEEGQPVGEVAWERVTIFDFGTDGEEDVENSTYVWFRSFMDKDEATIALQEVGITENPEVIQYTDFYEGEIEGVEVYEFWHKPSVRIPSGCYFLVVGGHVVDFKDYYPYDHGELPVAVWKIAHRRRSFYGSSHVDDAVVIQRQINELVSVIQKLTRECGDMMFVGHPAVVGEREAGNHMVSVSDPKQREGNGWIEPPQPPPLLFAQLETLIRTLYDVFGLNEILTGQENVRSGTSAKQIAYLTELDSMKLAGTARSLGKALRRAFRQSLKLMQQHCQEERLIQIAGPHNSVGVSAFQGSMIDGVDVRLEPRSGYERYGATGAADAEQLMMAGMIPPDEGMERRKTGLDQTFAQGESLVAVQEQIMEALHGAMPQPSPMVNPMIAVNEIRMALQTAQGRVDPMALQPLNMLLQAYQQLLQQQQMAQAQQQQPQGQPQRPKAQGQPQQQPGGGVLPREVFAL